MYDDEIRNDELLLSDLDEIVAIPSVYGPPAPGAPYGEGCRRAIEWFVDKARAYGLKAENYDNYCAYAEIGEGETCVGVLAHLDVVPAGNGWSTDPFKVTHDGKMLYGRGVADDKGAVVVCLHALRRLKQNIENGVTPKLKRRVRLIVGADEERGSSCIRHYLEVGGEVPEMSFVPDSEFPLVNSEKGISHIKFIFDDKKLAASISAIKAAECMNAVPDRAEITLAAGGPLETAIKKACGGAITSDVFSAYPAVNNIISGGSVPADFEITSLPVKIAANGVAEHASTPEKGDSALWKMLGFIAAFSDELGTKTPENIYEYLCTPLAASKLGIYVDDEMSGDLTMCMSMAQMNKGKLELAIDFRLPLGVKPETVAKAVCEKLGCTADILDYHENLFIAPDTPLIKALLGVYRKWTGDMTPPLKTGGGTYARELPNAVAFGCTPVGLDVNMHRADERFPVEQLFQNFNIYLDAMATLANL